MDIKDLDAATDYRSVVAALFGDRPTKGSGDEIYMVPPMRPEEKVEEMRFSISLKTGRWRDHKTGEAGNMLTLAKNYGPPDWRDRWKSVCPATSEFFGGGRGADTQTLGDGTEDLEAYTGQSMFSRAAVSLTQRPASTPKKEESDGDGGKTWRERCDLGKRLSSTETEAQFCEAWKVSADVFRRNGAWFHTFKAGKLAGKPQVFFPHYNPVDSEPSGIKKRGLEPLYRAGDKTLKSKNEAETKVGLFPWHSGLGKKPLLLVEGEKDWAVAEHEFGDRFDVVANLGGAGTWKQDWCKPIWERWKEIYVCYDEDSAGQSGMRKTATLLRRDGHAVRLVRLAIPDADIFDVLRGKDGLVADKTVLEKALAGADEFKPLEGPEADKFLKDIMSDKESQKEEWTYATTVFSVLRDHGAAFYYEDGGAAFMCFKRQVFRLDKGDPNTAVFLADNSGISVHEQLGARLLANLTDLAKHRGKPTTGNYWSAYRDHHIYIPLNNKSQDVLKIGPDSIDVVPNGASDVLFVPTQAKEVRYIPDSQFDMDKASELYSRIWHSLNCEPRWQEMMAQVFKAIWFYELIQTRPHIRFQGPAGSGKSTAGQLMSLVLYGSEDLVGEITEASVPRYARHSPVICMDDLENKEIRRDPWKAKVFLRAAVGGKRIKSGETDGESVSQDIRCWFATNGIFSIAEDNPALNERLLVVPFLERGNRRCPFMPMQFFNEIKDNRDLLMNYVFREVQRILRYVLDGCLNIVAYKLPPDKRPRLHEFYALLSIARGCYDRPDALTLEWLDSAMKGEKVAIGEASSLLDILFYIPSFLGDGTTGSGERGAEPFKSLNPKRDGDLWECNVPTRTLHQILHRIKRETGLPYSSTSINSLGAELRALKKAEVDGLFLESPSSAGTFDGEKQRYWCIQIRASNIRPLPHGGQLEMKTAEREPGADDEAEPF